MTFIISSVQIREVTVASAVNVLLINSLQMCWYVTDMTETPDSTTEFNSGTGRPVLIDFQD